MNKERLTIIDTSPPPHLPEHDHRLIQVKDYSLVQDKDYSLVQDKDYSDDTRPDHLKGDYSKINPNFRIDTSTRLHCYKTGETFDVQQIKEALDKKDNSNE